MGNGVRSVDSAIEDLITHAMEEFQIVAYAVGTGGLRVLSMIEDRLAAGVRTTFLVNRLETQDADVRDALERLAREYPHFQLCNVTPTSPEEDLHAKILVADRSRALIGSANLSYRGLIRNHELTLLVDGPPAGSVAACLDKLSQARCSEAARANA